MGRGAQRGPLAQLVERGVCIAEVRSSNLLGSTIILLIKHFEN